MKTLVLAAVLASITAGTAFAGTPLINARQQAQSHRIFNGVASGQLTYGETQRLIAGQNHVRNLKMQARADGVVTGWERARIHTAQNVQSARIFWKRHN